VSRTKQLAKTKTKFIATTREQRKFPTAPPSPLNNPITTAPSLARLACDEKNVVGASGIRTTGRAA
jgi:hypothetical protein